MARNRRDVLAVERDRPAVQLVEPHDQVDQGRLAGARRADDGDRLAGLGHQGEVLDKRAVLVIREGHVLELDSAAHGCGIGRRFRVVALFFGVEELEHPLE